METREGKTLRLQVLCLPFGAGNGRKDSREDPHRGKALRLLNMPIPDQDQIQFDGPRADPQESSCCVGVACRFRV